MAAGNKHRLTGVDQRDLLRGQRAIKCTSENGPPRERANPLRVVSYPRQHLPAVNFGITRERGSLAVVGKEGNPGVKVVSSALSVGCALVIKGKIVALVGN